MTTQITPTTELQSVNTMLSVIGEAPVNSITGTTTVDVSVAKNILDETSMSCLLYTSPSPRDYPGSRMPSSA